MRDRQYHVAIWVLSLLLLGAVSAGAQTNAEINAGIQLNFSTPGARSLGLGGAFLGLADDATAAFTNPAGLTILTKPEVSIEGRRWSYTNEFVNGGATTGTGTAGLDIGASESETTGASFLSVVYPRNRWAVAVYRHELANFEASIRTEGAEISDVQFQLFPIDAGMDLSIVNLGVSGAFRVTDDFSIGVGVSSYDFEMDSVTRRFSFDRSTLQNTQTQTGDDSDVAFNLGFRWALNDKWSLGGVYRQGPEFELDANASFSNPNVPAVNQTATFQTPDVYGVGIAFRPTDAITITADYDHIGYSSLTDDTVDIFSAPNDTSPPANQSRAAVRKLTVDDADELHVGIEYVFLKLKYPLALRFGGWSDPDHKVRFEGAVNTLDDRILQVLFQQGDDEIHYAAGFGVVFGERFQIDAGADFSDLVDTASLSAVVRF